MKRYVVLLIGLLTITALVAAGCGSSDNGGSTETGATETTNSDSGTSANKGAKDIFVNNCGSCHTLSAAGTSGTAGPNLDAEQPSKTEIEKLIRDGGDGMPKGLISGKDATQVTDYIVEVAGK